MVGHLLDVLGQPVGMKPFERHRDARMERAALRLKKVAVGHVMGQGVPEGVLGVRKQAGLVEESSSLQMRDATLNVGLGCIDDLPKHDEWNVVTDHGGGL